MVERSKQAWNEVGERFARIGRAVAARYEQLEQERGATTEQDRRALEEALQTVTRTLDQAFTSLGDTLRDPRAKEELKGAARSVADALGATFNEVAGEIRKRVGGSDTEPPSRPDADA